MKKFFLFVLMVGISLSGGLLLRAYREGLISAKASLANPEVLSAPREVREVEKPEKEPALLTLMFTGDIMLDRVVESSINKNGGGDFKFPFLKIADDLKEADILFGNLEGPISDKGKNGGKLYSFRMDPRAMDGLLFAGFEVLSIANNHMEDWGRAALIDTATRLKDAAIIPVGAGENFKEAYASGLLEKNGIKIAYLAFTDFPTFEATSEKSQGDLGASITLAGVARAREENIINGIKNAKNLGADFIVVSYHFGEEYQQNPTERQKYLARFAIDNGANLVVGHHPHVTQTYEEYKNGYIAYSLGNFIFDQNFSTSTMEGAILKIVLSAQPRGLNSDPGVVRVKIESKEIIKTKLNRFFQPEIML